MRGLAWLSVVLMGVVCAGAGELKEKKKDKHAAPDEVSSQQAAPAADGKSNGASEKNKKGGAAAEARKAERDAADEKESGGDESELSALVQTLGLSDAQKKEIGKEFERYQARLAEIKALPDKSPNEKLLKGPQRRALRADLAKWISAHVSPGQAQKFEAYESKRKRDLFDEHVNNRTAKLTEAVGLNENQQAKVRSIYNVQLGGIQNAADALYEATRKGGASPDLEKALEDKRDAMKRAVEGVLRPDQVEKYKKMDD